MYISGESSKLISSLDADSRYIYFKTSEKGSFAVICSQIDDKELAAVQTATGDLWLFDDKQKAIRSIRRLNKDVQIYTGSYDIEFS